jgi:hypothetical protein
MKGQARCAVAASPLAYLDTSIAAQLEENKAGGRVARMERKRNPGFSPHGEAFPDFTSPHPGDDLTTKKPRLAPGL